MTLQVINVISFIVLMFCGLNGVIYEIISPPKYENLLAALNIPWDFEQLMIITYVCAGICLVVLLITAFLQKKLGS